MLSKRIIKILLKKQYSISIAESCTGGKICYELAKISGISKIFKYGVIVYSNESKIKILNINKTKLKKYGAVSKEIAKDMSKNILKISKSDYSISTTGIAGPTGSTSTKPVGLVYISISNLKKTYVYKKKFNGTRLQIQKKACDESFKLLIKNF